MKNILLTWKITVNMAHAFETKWGNIENKVGIWTFLYDDKLSKFITKTERAKTCCFSLLQTNITLQLIIKQQNDNSCSSCVKDIM